MTCCGLFSRGQGLRLEMLAGMEEERNPSKATLYFGYGSNLWLDQMALRCPNSKFLGIARLKDFQWIISTRGYANIFPVVEDDSIEMEKHSYEKEVWGMVYSLQPEDERRLDRNEGVPYAYQKEDIDVEFWEAKKDMSIAVNDDPKTISTLVYLNRDLTKKDKPKEEYIYRMNMAIHDGLKVGIPQAYVDQVMRKFIPEQKE